MSNFSIGTDPEFFLLKNGNLKSAIGLIPGTKEEPHMLPCGAGLQVDNVALEFASPVGTDKREFLRGITTSLFQIKQKLPRDYSISLDIAAAFFPEKELQHPDAQLFGCSPDYDVWRMVENEAPNMRGNNLRTCGGHIHIGSELVKGDVKKQVRLVKVMDCMHGLISSVLDVNKGSKIRREVYGKPGCFRPTEYGLEYRVLSNWWLKSKESIKLMYSLTKDALNVLNNNGVSALITDMGGQSEIEKGINGVMSDGQEDNLLRYLSDESIKYSEAIAKSIKK